MRFGILGALELWDTSGAPVPIPEVKVRALLAALLVREGAPVPADRLVEELWGRRPPADPARVLRAKVSLLRGVLEQAEPDGRSRLVHGTAGYRLEVGTDDLDASRFRALVRSAGTATDAGSRVAALDEALGLWRGAALAGFADEGFLAAAATRLEDERLTALEERARARVELGDHARVADELTDLVAHHPLRERLRAAHMRALYAAGRQAEALASFEELRRLLAEELGADPGPEITTLHQEILRQEARLGPVGGAGAPMATGTPGTPADPIAAGGAGAGGTGAAGTASTVGTPRTPNGPATPGTQVVPLASSPPASPSDGWPPRTDAPPPGVEEPAVPRSNLPSLVDSTIGREAEIAEIRAALTRDRAVTVTGPGGVGKTRLALEVAHRLAARRSGGVWLVELGSLSVAAASAGRVVEAVESAMGVNRPASAGRRAEDPAEALAAALNGRATTLVLDNCEHVIDAAAETVRTLLRMASDLRVLVTSREPLRVPGERVVELPPLDVWGKEPTAHAHTSGRPTADPPVTDTCVTEGSTADDPSTEESTAAGGEPLPAAMRLFAERAAASAPGFTLNERTIPLVRDICCYLDGIPLAIELAANRVRALGVDGVAARIDDLFALLTGGTRGAPERQRTLRGTIDWSWDLLDDPERTVLRRLAVVVGVCTLDAAEEICAGPTPVPGGVVGPLSRLVECSLVQVVHGADGTGYRLLDSIRAYAAERLAEAGETETVAERHLRHYTRLAEHADPLLRGGEQGFWLRRLDSAGANLRAAHDHAVRAADADAALRLAVAQLWYHVLRGSHREIRGLLAEALALDGGAPAPRALATAWQVGLCVYAMEQDDPVGRAEAALDGLDGGTEAHPRARVMVFVGSALVEADEPAPAEKILHQALALAREHDDTWSTAAALCGLAWNCSLSERSQETEGRAREALRLFRDVGDRWGQLQAMSALADAAELGGRVADAVTMDAEGVRIADELGMWAEKSFWLSRVGWDASRAGDVDEAERLLRQARRLATEIGYVFGERYADLNLGMVERRAGRYDAAVTHLNGWLTDPRSDRLSSTLVLIELGYVAERRGELAEAVRHHRAALAEAVKQGTPTVLVWALEGCAAVCARYGRYTEAARLLGAASTARAPGDLSALDNHDLARTEEAVREALGEKAFATGHREGRRLTLDEAAGLAEEATAAVG